MLISVPALREIGPWDESFLLYSEETEFALRAADLGWTLWYEPAAVVEHIGGDAKVNPMLAALLTVNKVRLFRRRRGPLASLLYYLAVLLGEGVRAATGRSTARAAVLWLVRPSRRIRALPG
jgi:GT2 family glycosyltransferase